MGIVLIYRSTRVINFAVGNMGLPGATLFALTMINYGWPFWPALIFSLVVGALVGLVTEVIVVKRLFHRPRVVLLIATVAIADFWRAIVVLTFPEVSGEQRTYPAAIGREFTDVGGDFSALEWAGVGADEGILVRGADLQTLITVPIVALALGWAITRTTFGKAISASADNPDLSRLSGVNPHVVSTVVWTIGGFLATLTMILISSGRATSGIGTLGAFTLTNALAAAVIAGLRSFPRAMAGGIAIAFLDNFFGFNVSSDPGLSTLAVFIAVIGALYWQSRNEPMGEALTFATKVRPLPPAVREIWWVRQLPRIAIGILLFVVVMIAWHHVTLFEWVDRFVWFWDNPPERIAPSKFFLFSTVVAFAVITASLTVITGWSGQVSLAQGAYAGIGALTAAAINRGIELDLGFGDTRLIDVELAGLPTLPSIALAAVVTAAVAAVTGIGALRVSGVKLAISTFAFALAAEVYLYNRPFFSQGADSVVFERGWLFDWNLRDQRSFFYFSLVCLTLTILVIGRLRRSGIGRSIIAVRDNSDTASAYTVSPARMKLTAFALAGGVAGLGGALLGNAYRQIRFADAHFQLDDSIVAVNMAVIGGLGSVVGPVLGSFWVLGLPSFFDENAIVTLLTSSVGFLIVLMYFPGGFVQLAYQGRDAIVARLEARSAAEPPFRALEAPAPSNATAPLELIAGWAAVVMKVALTAYVVVFAANHLVGDGDWTLSLWFVDGGYPIEHRWFDVYLALAALSGLAALAVLVRLARTPSSAVGASGTKFGYTAYLVFEPLVPFLWPWLIRRWLG